ncbi:putative Transmembrane protein [Quillaja saponaria]|uniref:Transmembrane protein n=1 Tax=Quillaja saponaria TaxID=32244 RepID=A0AAD7LN02_QUISA|nr:putative Transmembrane protein [Quillaja saponaria]
MNMDQVKSQKLAPLSHFIRPQFLKKLTQLLLSVSVFSFLFSNSSWLSFTKFPIQLFSHNIDKNCIFLICNGLLVFLAKYSGLFRSLSGHSRIDEPAFKYIEVISQTESLEKEVVEEDIGSVQDNYMKQGTENEYLEEQEQEQIQESSVDDHEQGKEISQLILEEETGICDAEDREEDKGSERIFLVDKNVQDTDVVEEENGMLSTEELNKKFDEFIRRMKEDLRIEARRQLIVV